MSFLGDNLKQEFMMREGLAFQIKDPRTLIYLGIKAAPPSFFLRFKRAHDRLTGGYEYYDPRRVYD